MSKGEKSGGGNRKKGRNRVSCDRYRLEGRKEKNKRLKVARHIRNQPNDMQAQKVMERL